MVSYLHSLGPVVVNHGGGCKRAEPHNPPPGSEGEVEERSEVPHSPSKTQFQPINTSQ